MAAAIEPAQAFARLSAAAPSLEAKHAADSLEAGAIALGLALAIQPVLVCDGRSPSRHPTSDPIPLFIGSPRTALVQRVEAGDRHGSACARSDQKMSATRPGDVRCRQARGHSPSEKACS